VLRPPARAYVERGGRRRAQWFRSCAGGDAPTASYPAVLRTQATRAGIKMTPIFLPCLAARPPVGEEPYVRPPFAVRASSLRRCTP